MNLITKIFKYLFLDFIRALVIYMPGPTGRKLRYLYYKKKFKKCGKNVIIDEGVIIQNPEWISVGDNVWIDRYCVLIAGAVDLKGKIKKKKENKNFKWQEGELIIGSGCHIGVFNIIQAHGGVYIGDFVTTSAGVKIYSLSNYTYDEQNKSRVTYANCMIKDKAISYILSPIVLEEGVWLALNCTVLGGTIGKNAFIASNSIVYNDIPENSYASGAPAQRIKERFKLEEKSNEN